MTALTNQTSFRLDALQELVNIGGGHAASSFATLTGKTVHMDMPTLEEMSYEQIFEEYWQEDDVVDAVMMKLIGIEGGTFLFVLSEDETKRLATMLYEGKEVTDEALIESAIKELVNILVHSFLNAVIQLIGVNLLSSVPIMMKDMFGSIFSSLYLEQGQYDNQVIVINNVFYCEGQEVSGRLFFVPKPGMMDRLANRLGV